jgi:MoxR-like ATPase
VIDAAGLIELQQQASRIHIADTLLDYLQAVLDFSRNSPQFEAGLSPRAGLALKQCAQAWALLEGRDYAIPEDLQAILPSVANHRLRSANGGNMDTSELLAKVAVP